MLVANGGQKFRAYDITYVSVYIYKIISLSIYLFTRTEPSDNSWTTDWDTTKVSN